MKQRCLNPVNPNYKDYGGRGIRVCERWLEFENFLKDMGDPPQRGRGKGLLSIERINNDGDYEPSNCRWAPMKEQLLNRRKTVWMTHQGKRKPLLVWCREYRIDYATAKYRLKMGKDSKEVLEKPESRIGPVTHGGVTKSLVEWSKQTGIRVATLSYRLRNGWPVKEALEISVK